jgi:hypothetical protein
MNRLLLIPAALLLILSASCGSGENRSSDKIRLEFKPEKGKPLHATYWFSVNNTGSGDVSAFEMQISGSGETSENGIVTLNMKNDSIRMSGKITGKEVNGSAEGPDSLTGDAKLVALPVFALLHRSYRSIYNAQLDKKAEMQMSGDSLVDSTENKMQFLLRYPKTEVGVGDSWERQIMISAGNKMTCNAKYTLKELQGDTAMISMDGRLSGSGDKFGNEYTMDGRIGGDFKVYIKTGWPFEADTHQEFVLKMAGKEIPMVYDIKSRIK